MVKKNRLLIGCLALLLVLSVGYALFSETITINGTATAKGSFDITTTCAAGYSDEILTMIGNGENVGNNDYLQNGFANSICDVNGNAVTMTTELLYPTAKRAFTVKMTNTGSIPALIWGSASDKTVESLSLRDTYANGSWALKSKQTDEVIKSGKGAVDYDGIIIGTIIISKDGRINSSENLVYDSEKGYAGIKLNTGDSIYTVLGFSYPEDANLMMSDNGKTEYFEFKMSHEYKWEQYTDSPNYEPTTFDEWCFAGC